MPILNFGIFAGTSQMIERFSDRQGFRPAAAQITVRHDAPSKLRSAIPLLAKAAGMSPSAIRETVCEVLIEAPDPDNWSEYPNIWNEVAYLMEEAPWYRVYDIAEQIYADLLPRRSWDRQPADEFERRLN